MIYSETHIDVIDCYSGDWVQTLNLKRSMPLNQNGMLTACFATEQPYVVYLRNTNKGTQSPFFYITVSPILYDFVCSL